MAFVVFPLLPCLTVAADPLPEVQQAIVLTDQGRCKEAIELLKAQPESVATQWWLGQAYERIGDLDSARDAYAWFVTEPRDFLARWRKDREKAFDDAEQVTLIARAIDRWATLSGSYEKLPELHDELLNMFVRAYDVIDRGYWPAHVAAAEYFLSHDNPTQAISELQAALAVNPNDIRSHDLLGKIALSKWNFDEADAQIAAIRKVDADSVAADLLQARNLLQQRRAADAAAAIQRVLARQPEHLEALGLLAAAYALQLQDDKAAEILQRVEAIDPDNATAYFELADQLGAMRQYPRAAAMYKIAIERAPWWTAPRNGLGLLYTQSGDEQAARIILEQAHALDPFNLRTTNYLRLLDDLEAFARRETEHFVVLYDAQADPIIAEYFSEYLESIRAEVSNRYGATPQDKTLVEVFPTHDAFSVRTTGSPWIGTVGASTGRVIALVSPRKGAQTSGPFNWAEVLRHEYTHTITLAATGNRIPHWMTEGLAVGQENMPLKWQWAPMLYAAATQNRLFTLENLTWAFIRPRRPEDRSLAYAQSYWVCAYIEQTWGHDAILKMLQAFRAGGTEQAVFHNVLGKDIPQFEADFFAWARQQVAGWGYDPQTTSQYEQLREQGEERIKSGNFQQAVAVWQQIAAIRPMDALPHQRLAGLYLSQQINQPAKAIEHLKILHAGETGDSRYAKRIARIYRDAKQFADARHYAMQAVYVDPYDLAAHRLLLELAEQTEDRQTTLRQRRVIPILEQWISANRPKPPPSE